jgi:hypothetical protein
MKARNRIASVLAHSLAAAAVGACTGGATVNPGTPAGCSKEPVLVREDQSCAEVWRSPCGLPSGVDPSDGLSEEECRKVCGTQATKNKYWGCELHRGADLPAPSFDCATCVAGGKPSVATTSFALASRKP